MTWFSHWKVKKELVRKIGLREAFLMAVLMEEADSADDDGGWFEMTRIDLEKLSTYSRSRQDISLAKLERYGLIETEVKGLPPKRHVRVDYDAMVEF